MKKKKSTKQILALTGIGLLVGLFVLSMILAFIDTPLTNQLFKVSISLTFIVPVILYVIIMFYKLSHKNDVPEDIIYADEKDDPFHQEDFPEDSTKNS